MRAARADDFAHASRAHLQEVIFVYDAQKWKTVSAVSEVMHGMTFGRYARGKKAN